MFLHIRRNVIRKKWKGRVKLSLCILKTNRYPLLRFPHTIQENRVKITNFSGPAVIRNWWLTRGKWTGMFYFRRLSMTNIMEHRWQMNEIWAWNKGGMIRKGKKIEVPVSAPLYSYKSDRGWPGTKHVTPPWKDLKQSVTKEWTGWGNSDGGKALLLKRSRM